MTGVCPFLHPEDNEDEIVENTARVRQRIFKAMDHDKYALPPPIRLEIGIITQEEFEIMERRQYKHDQLVEESKRKGQRTRSRSPKGSGSVSPTRSNPRTPTPDNANENRGKGQGKGLAPTPAESIAVTAVTTDALGSTDSRQRDHTSGQDEQSDAEVVAPPPADTTTAEEQVDKEDNDDSDHLVDFGSSPAEVKEETDETQVEHNETMEQADQEMTAVEGDYNVVTGAEITQDPTIDA